LEVFYLGICFVRNTDLSKNFLEYVSMIEQESILNIEQREWIAFNNNILTLLDVTSFPRTIKESCHNFSELLLYAEKYAPKKFYP
jgi:hypothetical protein